MLDEYILLDINLYVQLIIIRSLPAERNVPYLYKRARLLRLSRIKINRNTIYVNRAKQRFRYQLVGVVYSDVTTVFRINIFKFRQCYAIL